MKYAEGDQAFIVESTRFIRAVRIVKFSGGFYTVRFIERNGGMNVRPSRLFPTKEAAEASIPKNQPSPEKWLHQ